jgi:hypothetical protein
MKDFLLNAGVGCVTVLLRIPAGQSPVVGADFGHLNMFLVVFSLLLRQMPLYCPKFGHNCFVACSMRSTIYLVDHSTPYGIVTQTTGKIFRTLWFGNESSWDITQ